MSQLTPIASPLTVSYGNRVSCRSCGGALAEVLALGVITPSDFLLPDEPDPAGIPMTLMTCERCGLVQLRQTVDDAVLYRRYWYQSGVNEVMRQELNDVVQSAINLVGLEPGDTVIDIGANDGTLLSFVPLTAFRVGVDPAQNLSAALSRQANLVINDFWSADAYTTRLQTQLGNAREDSTEQRQALVGYERRQSRTTTQAGDQREDSSDVDRSADLHRGMAPEAIRSAQGEEGFLGDSFEKASCMPSPVRTDRTVTETTAAPHEVQDLANDSDRTHAGALSDLSTGAETGGRPHQAVGVVPGTSIRSGQREGVVFPLSSATWVARQPRIEAKIIFSCAMFYDLEDPRRFVHEIDRVLAEDGVWVVQFQDLAQQIQTNAFDNCCYEHRLYLSLASFTDLLEGTDLVVTDVERRAINGGSLRVFVQRHGEVVQSSVELWRMKEAKWITPRALERFAWQAQITKEQIRGLVGQAVKKTGPIDLYAASTKSSTLVQFCELQGWIARAVERTPEKVGRRTSGTGITIVSEDEWRAHPGGLALLGAWQFAEAFMAREREYLAQGGGFIVPLPWARIVYQ